jgi:hypothetical protein
MKKKIISLPLLLFIPFFVGIIFIKERPTVTQAQMSRVGSATIDAHEICRNVVNSDSKDLMIPYKTKGEWCSFLTAPLTDVSKTYCTICYWQGCSCTNCGGVYVCEDYNVGSCP